MHASIRDLLSVRDGEPVDGRVMQHLEACVACRVELERVASLKRRLIMLCAPDPPADAWDRIEKSVNMPKRGTRVGLRAGLAAVAGAAVLVLALVLGVSRDSAPVQNVDQASAPPADPIASGIEPLPLLIARSQRLEAALGELPRRPRAERAGTALTLDVLEQQIAYLDANLTLAVAAGLPEAQQERLWEQRVLLLDSLVKVRYAQAQTLEL